MKGLPRSADGQIMTSASFGELKMVLIEWSTDAENKPIPEGEEPARTYHGPFVDEVEATEWIEAYPDDPDVYDYHVIPLNAVRPDGPGGLFPEGKVYDHEPAPDDMPEPGDRCKECREDIVWIGPGQYDWMHVDDVQNK